MDCWKPHSVTTFYFYATAHIRLIKTIAKRKAVKCCILWCSFASCYNGGCSGAGTRGNGVPTPFSRFAL